MSDSFLGLGAAFLTLICWTLGLIAFTEASKRANAHTVNHIRLLFALVLLTLIAGIGLGIGIPGLFNLPGGGEQWLWLGLSGLVGLSIGDFFSFSALAMIGPRTTSLFNALAPAAALFTGMLLLDESITAVGAAGILFSITGIAWVVLLRKDSSYRPAGTSHKKAILFAALAAICQGVGLVLAKKGMNVSRDIAGISPVHATWIRMLIAVSVLYVLELLKGNYKLLITPLRQYPGSIKYILAGTLVGPVIGVSLSLYSASKIETYLSQTVLSMLPISILPVSWLIYREKISKIAWLAAFLAVSGVIVLSYQHKILSFFSE